VRYWKGIRGTQEPVQAEAVVQQRMWDEIDASQAQASNEDDLLPKAIALVQEHDRASISMLQRRLRIGYSRAARLIETMEKKGIVGPSPTGGGSRPVREEAEAEHWQEQDLPPL